MVPVGSAPELKSIPTENLSGPRAVGAGPFGHDLRLELLQAHLEVGVAPVRAAGALGRALLRVAAAAVQQPPSGVFHRDQLHLKESGGPAHLGGADQSQRVSGQGGVCVCVRGRAQVTLT